MLSLHNQLFEIVSLLKRKRVIILLKPFDLGLNNFIRLCWNVFLRSLTGVGFIIRPFILDKGGDEGVNQYLRISFRFRTPPVIYVLHLA